MNKTVNIAKYYARVEEIQDKIDLIRYLGSSLKNDEIINKLKEQIKEEFEKLNEKEKEQINYEKL